MKAGLLAVALLALGMGGTLVWVGIVLFMEALRP